MLKFKNSFLQDVSDTDTAMIPRTRKEAFGKNYPVYSPPTNIEPHKVMWIVLGVIAVALVAMFIFGIAR